MTNNEVVKFWAHELKLHDTDVHNILVLGGFEKASRSLARGLIVSEDNAKKFVACNDRTLQSFLKGVFRFLTGEQASDSSSMTVLALHAINVLKRQGDSEALAHIAKQAQPDS